MENFDKLVITLLDSNAMIGCFKKELGKALNIPTVCIGDVWLESEMTNTVITQVIKVALIDARIDKELLMKLPFKYIYENCIVFEVGDVFV